MANLKAKERRNKILETLESSKEPLSGSFLAARYGVSRQVVVTDIAILRSEHPNLVSTHRGYIMLHADSCRCVFKVLHTDEETCDELLNIVNLGGKIIDVYVNHRVYGTIRKPLDISSKRDLDHFMDDIASSASTPLKNITNGYHFHTVEARSEEVLKEIEEMLKRKGYLIETLAAPVIYGPKDYSRD